MIFEYQASAWSIVYSSQLDAYKAMYPADDTDIQAQTLDVIIAHEIGHTKQGAHAFGIMYSPKFSYPNEFDVIRKVENPYRQYLGLPLRLHYGGAPGPSPIITK